jgi:hypothetical protein
MARQFKHDCEKIREAVMDFNDVCCDILSQKPVGLMSYAIAYAEAGTRISDPIEVRMQIPYILSNAVGWKGEEARSFKTELKRILEVVK